MSIKLMSKVWDSQYAQHIRGKEGRWVTSQTKLLVMLILADYADDNGGSCFPSQTTIAKKALCARETVHRIIRSLVADGLVTIKKVRRNNEMRLFFQDLDKGFDLDSVEVQENAPKEGCVISDHLLSEDEPTTEMDETVDNMISDHSLYVTPEITPSISSYTHHTPVAPDGALGSQDSVPNGTGAEPPFAMFDEFALYTPEQGQQVEAVFGQNLFSKPSTYQPPRSETEVPRVSQTPQEFVWGEGVDFLTRNGATNFRGVLGEFMRDHHHEDVVTMLKGLPEHRLDYVPYMKKLMKGYLKKDAKLKTNEELTAEREAAANAPIALPPTRDENVYLAAGHGEGV